MNAKDIAGRLTKAQREYLTTRAQWRSITGWTTPCWMTFPPPNTHVVLMRLALVDSDGQIMGLGLAVREAIMQEEG